MSMYLLTNSMFEIYPRSKRGSPSILLCLIKQTYKFYMLLIINF